MIQLQVLSGKLAGRDIAVRQFPFLAGRAAEAGLRLDDAGVWERHVQIDFKCGEGFLLHTQDDAFTSINGEQQTRCKLRNGDVIEMGSVRLRFWLARSPQKTLHVREALTWAALVGLFVVQAGLILWLFQ